MQRCGLESKYSQESSSCEQGDEPSYPMKGRESYEQLSDYQFIKNDSPPYGHLFHAANGSGYFHTPAFSIPDLPIQTVPL